MARKKFKPVAVEPCAWHISHKLSYFQFFEDADRRTAEGQEQVQCKVCGYWHWPDQFGVDPISQIKPDTL